MRTISEETLTWNTPVDPKPAWLKDLVNKIDLRWNRDLDRSRIFALNEANRWTFWRGLRAVFKQDPSTYAMFGLVPDLPRYNIDGSVRKQPPAGETTFEVFSIRRHGVSRPTGHFTRTSSLSFISESPYRLMAGTSPTASSGFVAVPR